MINSRTQSNDNSPAGGLRAVLTFEDFSEEVQIPDLCLQVTLGNASKTINLPFNESLLLESNDLNVRSKIQLQLEETDGDIVGYTELKIPATAFVLYQTEINPKVQFQLVKGPKTSFSTTVNAIFLNNKGSKDQDAANEAQEEVKDTRALSTSGSRKKLLIDLERKESGSPKQRKSQESSPLSKRDSPSMKQGLEDQYSINYLIHLNREQKNLPEGLLDESSVSQPQFESESPASRSKGTASPGLNSPAKVTTKKHAKKSSVSESKEKKVLRSSMTQVIREKSPKGQPALYEAVKRLTSETKSPTKIKRAQTMSIPEGIDLTDEKQLPDVLGFLEKELTEQDYLTSYVEFIKNTMLTMEFKITEMDILRAENEKLKQQVKLAEESKIKIQEQATASVNSQKQENNQLSAKISALLTENQTLTKKYEGSQTETLKLKDSLAKQTLLVTQKTNELVNADFKNTELIETRNNLKKAQESLGRVEAQRTNDQKNFSEALEKARKSFEEAQALYDQTFKEKKEIYDQFNQEKAAHQDTRNKLLITERKLENAEAYKEAIKSLEVQRDELLRQLAELRADKDNIYKLVEKAQQELGLKSREFEGRENEHIQKASILEERVKTYELKNATLSREIEKQELNIFKLNSQVVELDEMKSANEKVNEEVERLKERLAQAVQHSLNLNSGIDTITENHEAMSHRNFELEKTNTDLVSAISEKEQEIGLLKATLHAAINEIPKYVPIKDDPVDVALAGFLNAKKENEKYKVLFVRESEGVYQFGTKRIYIKVEGDRVLIRVGGGYMTLEELLETIAPTEYEKLQRYTKMSQDDATKVVTKNIVLNQVIAGKCINTMAGAKTQAYKMVTSPKADSSPLTKVDMRNSFTARAQKHF